MRKTLMSSLKRLTVAALAVCMATTAVACDNKDPGNEPDEPPVVSVSAPKISSFSIQADTGAAYGKMNEMHKLVWTITGDHTDTAVSVKLSGEAAADTDYEYTEQTQKIVFKTTGSYTVTLKASNGDKSTSKSATIDISEFSAPVITMPQDASGYMNTAVSFEPMITYDTADSANEQTVAVTLDDANAEENTDYTLTDGQFTPKKVGEYKVTVSVTSAKGKRAQSTWTYTSLEVGAAAVNKDADNLASFGTEDDRLLVETNKATAFVYTAQNYDAAQFDVAVSLKKGETSVESAVQHNAATRTLTVTATETGDYTLVITFTNKTDATKTSSVTWDIRVKNDIAAPEFGEDPFDGTWANLKPGVGMELYFDATDDKVQNLTYSDVKFEIVSNADSSATAAGAQIVDTGAYANHPYLIATGTGKVTVKMTVSDGVNTATANKEFTVSDHASNDAYFKSVYTDLNGILQNTTSGVWVDGVQVKGTSTLVCTKKGFIVEQNTGEYRGLGFYIGNRTEFTVTFDHTLLKEPTGVNTILVNVDADTGYKGNIWCNWNNGSNFGGAGIDEGISTATQTVNATTVARPTLNQTVKYKIEAKDGILSLSVSSNDGESYTVLVSRASNGLIFKQIFVAAMDTSYGLFENFTLA